MGYYREADIPALLRDFGVAVTLGATTVKGLVDEVESDALQGSGPAAVVEETKSVTIKTGSLPGLVVGSSLTVDGVSAVVRDRQKIGDGALTRLLLD